MDIGVGWEKTFRCENLAGNIERAISNDRPVIVWIDPYYLSIRKDTYEKTHMAHTILVYGYDHDKQIYTIIEHRNRENLYYQEYEISYQELEDAYLGYLERFASEAYDTYYEFFGHTERQVQMIQDKTANTQTMVRNLLIQQENVKKGLEDLVSFVETFEIAIADEWFLQSYVNELLAGINQIITAKQVEKYRLDKLLVTDEQSKQSLDDILACWLYVRSVVAKYLFSSSFKPEAFETALEKLLQLPELEQNYFQSLTSFKVVNLMRSATIEAKIIELIQTYCGLDLPVEEVSLQCDLGLYGFNSLQAIKVIVAIEEEYNIEINPEELAVASLNTLEEIIQFIEQKIATA
ncbi:phosphopantetheine-binding protein [Brevibacillus antibioticus]|nr:phosphopantetheine-binding protein [Brevibacillus antibioticus]